jgi:thioesterase domain-containing protein
MADSLLAAPADAPSGTDPDSPPDRVAAAAAPCTGDPLRHLVTIRPGSPGALPLWLVHPAGGSLVLYEPMASHFADDRRILGVEAVGLDGDEPLCRVADVADHQVATITAVQPTGPYRIVGYSVGGVIALEIARRLRARGDTVEFLGAIEAGVPAGPPPMPRLREKYGAFVRARDVVGFTDAVTTAVRRRARWIPLPDATASGTPQELAHRRVLDGMVHAYYSYEPEPLDIDVTLFLGRGHLSEALVGQWSGLATGGVRVRWLPGSHTGDEILRPPHAEPLAEAIDAVLRASETRR